MNLLLEGLTTMAIGMGFVLLFLCLLILAMNIMSKVIAYVNTIFPEVVATAQSTKNTAKNTANDDEAIALALAVVKSRG